MRAVFKILTLLIAILTFTECKKDRNSSAYYISTNIDGVPTMYNEHLFLNNTFSPGTGSITTGNTNTLTISAMGGAASTKDTSNIQFSFINYIEVPYGRSFDTTISSFFECVLILKDIGYLNQGYEGLTLTLHIQDSTSISGTFSGTLKELGYQDSVLISNGSFYLPLFKLPES
jgi:hypothetical protein